MKRTCIYLAPILWILFYSCNTENTIPDPLPHLSSHIYSRGIISKMIPEGHSALFNACGNITLTNETFTLTNGKWTNGQELNWEENNTEKTSITALYPLCPDNEYSTMNLYANNELADILLAQDTLFSQADIHLNFKHLFSKLTIHLDDPIVNTIKTIYITAPKQISYIDPSTGEFTVIDAPHTTERIISDTCDYYFLIPPHDEEYTLTMTISTETQEYTHTLNPHTFLSGHEYICNLVSTKSTPGIRTNEEFILFTQLINELPESEEALQQFGDTVNGVMTYRLLNDLNFQNEELSQLLPIKQKDNRFKDVFDGNGHCISHLELKSYNGTAGLFGSIDTIGVVKNLHISDTYLPEGSNSTKSGAGILVGYNFGTIDHCSITNCEITLEGSSAAGCITGIMRDGKITNCYVQNSTITEGGNTGGIAGENLKGIIANCFSASNKLENISLSQSGGICGYTNEGTIYNCYVYNISFSLKSRGGRLAYRAQNSVINNCFYNLASPENIVLSTNNTITDCLRYDSKTFKTIDTETLIVTLLNQWIDQNPLYRPWKTDETGTLPAIFQ